MQSVGASAAADQGEYLVYFGTYTDQAARGIYAFRFQPATGKLIPIQHALTLGKTPRNFSRDPSGEYLFAANQGSDAVVPFKVDQESGKLTPIGAPISVPKQVCVLFVKAQ